MNPEEKNLIKVLMVDDDPDDCLLMREAFYVSGIPCELIVAHDGKALLDRLKQEKISSGVRHEKVADIILLDLNMPRKDGREILAFLNREPVIANIPVVVFTTSRAEEDVRAAYGAGAAAYVIKPDNFDGLLNFAKRIVAFQTGTSIHAFTEALQARPIIL